MMRNLNFYNLCISILEFKYEVPGCIYVKKSEIYVFLYQNLNGDITLGASTSTKFMYFYIRI